MIDDKLTIPSVSVKYAHDGRSATADALGMRPMQARVWLQRGERYLLIKSPPASGKSRALMFVALDKLRHQGLKQAIIDVPEKSIGASFHDEPLSKFGFEADWHVEPRWNLCDAPGSDNGGKVEAVRKFLAAGNADVLVGSEKKNADPEVGVPRRTKGDANHNIGYHKGLRLGGRGRLPARRSRSSVRACINAYGSSPMDSLPDGKPDGSQSLRAEDISAACDRTDATSFPRSRFRRDNQQRQVLIAH